MNTILRLLLDDQNRAWTSEEIAQELEVSRGEAEWDLQELSKAGSARWILWRGETLWCAQIGEEMAGSTEDAIAAFEHLSSRSRMPFVSIEELGNELSWGVEQTHEVLRELAKQGRAKFSGTNIAVLSPSSKRWAMRWQGQPCALVRIV